MKSNTWTIIKKEFARFFGDRTLVFTSVIMPGLLIYLIYSLMGEGIGKMVNDGADEEVAVTVENMPESMAPMLSGIDSAMTITNAAFDQDDIDRLLDKEVNCVLVRFPAGFDSLIQAYDPASGELAPNVEIYYNSTNNASSRVYHTVDGFLTSYEDGIANRFDVNRADSEDVSFNMADDDDIGAMVWSKILPMLIVMMLFSGVMAIAPSAIAGEKERGTIATLLVTPMPRNQLALGKVISLGCLALLSGISSFIGIALSLPKMMGGDAEAMMSFNYTAGDYMAVLLLIFATVIIIAAAVSMLSALAKDVKNAGTMVMPLMLLVMLCGLIPMFQSTTPTAVGYYLIPVFNSVEALTAVFAHEVNWTCLTVTLACNVAYTAIAVWGLTRMFNSEKVMFGK